MDNKIKLLSRLAEENAIGQARYEVFRFAATGLIGYMGIKENEYIDLLRELSDEGLIDIYIRQIPPIYIRRLLK